MTATLGPALEEARRALRALRASSLDGAASGPKPRAPDTRALGTRAEGASTDPLIADFLLDIDKIGLLIGADPALARSPELRAFLDQTAPELMGSHVALLFYPGSIVRDFQGTWEHDEWLQLCRRRSALQFFLDLYRDTELAPFLEEIETDYLDENVRAWGEREGFLSESEIEPHIPRSHWWWWLPGTPPPPSP